MKESKMHPTAIMGQIPAPPQPSICYSRIILGEITPLLSTMRRATPRWSSNNHENEQEPLVQKLRELQMTLTKLDSDEKLDPCYFLDPFLAVIRSEDTTGPVTKCALASVNRILSYGLIGSDNATAANAVEAVAAAVTHARFVGTDQGADEVVLWEILTVLRTLILGPVGHLLTNESVCEILNSSFRICFETRLSELLRNCTEDALRHMVQLLFARLPQFKDDSRWQGHVRRLKMQTGSDSKGKKGRDRYLRPTPSSTPPPDNTDSTESPNIEPESSEQSPTETEPEDVQKSPQNETASIDSGIIETPTTSEPVDISHTHLSPDLVGSIENIDSVAETDGTCNSKSEETENLVPSDAEDKEELTNDVVETEKEKEDFINLQGVKFTQEGVIKEGNSLVPYGMPCVREVFRFLISLTSPTNDQNTPTMINTSLSLLTVALEVAADHINNAPSLLILIKDQLCRNLFLLLKPDTRPVIFMSSLRVCTLLFESLRNHLKFQLEMFLNKLSDIITSESQNVPYSHKELALETVVQLWRMPGLITELFLNFDCDLYAANVFEDLTKILSKNAFPILGVYSTNLLSLEALITAIEIISRNCPSHVKANNPPQSLNLKGNPSLAPNVVAPVSSGYLLGIGLLAGFSPVTPLLRAHTILKDETEVSREHLLAIKEKKKLLAAGTDLFKTKPDKGIQFLQDNGIIGLENKDIALFLRENPHLDKLIMGEYISKKKNIAILSAFVVSYDFKNLRIDECLRFFLEAFRLPGEAPLIANIIEQFSSHWHLSNGEPFEKEDAAFTLAYAVIMLNVDQHNKNAKKQNIPMTLDQFRNNLRGVNDGKDFDQDMLEEVYLAIRSEEIVMPAEHTGMVKENYFWKMLLRRGATKEGAYIIVNENRTFDRDLFAICWGPTVASLSYVFDKSNDESFIEKALTEYKRCSFIAARYGMSDVFDNLVVSLCQFTTLTVASNETPEYVAISFGGNKKAQMAAKVVFNLVTTHGDILRDGWKNILDLLLQLFRCGLLPSCLVESEDFIEPSGKIVIMQEIATTTPRVESGILSSLYSYIALGDAGSMRGSSLDDAQFTENARQCIIDCHPEKLIDESAFLRCDSLNDLLKAMIGAGNQSNIPEQSSQDSFNGRESASLGQDEHSQAFLLELVVSVFVANKDRASSVWPTIRDHIYSLLMSAAASERYFLLERCVVAVLRITKVLLRRPELANPILQSLRMLLVLKPHILARVSLQVVAGVHEVLCVNADHIRDPNDWAVLFTLLECTGAGAKPPPMVNSEHPESISDAGSISDSDLGSSSGLDSGHCTEPGYTSDSVNLSSEAKTPEGEGPHKSRAASPETLHSPGGWILVGKEGEIEPVAVKGVAVNEWDIVHQRQLGVHRAEALVRAVDTLSLLVRDHHITTSSLPSAVQACRTFVEATLNGGKSLKKLANKDNPKSPNRKKTTGRKREDKSSAPKRSKSPVSSAYDADESDSDETPATYQQISEKLLDLMDTLHTSSGHIVGISESSAEEQTLTLWHQALCPLLQGIARYCCDVRTSIRNMAMTYLQRALLNHDLQSLSANQWEACFNKVLFPLLAKLLQPLPLTTASALEETRVRAATLVQKVYLRHLTPLMSLPTFTALWLTILDFMDKYLHVQKSDHLSDAIPEILKNMLLVMETTQEFAPDNIDPNAQQVFHTSEGFTRLWTITWDRIDAFLPDFRLDLFKSHPPSEIHRIDVQSTEAAPGSQDVSANQPSSFRTPDITQDKNIETTEESAAPSMNVQHPPSELVADHQVPSSKPPPNICNERTPPLPYTPMYPSTYPSGAPDIKPTPVYPISNYPNIKQTSVYPLTPLSGLPDIKQMPITLIASPMNNPPFNSNSSLHNITSGLNYDNASVANSVQNYNPNSLTELNHCSKSNIDSSMTSNLTSYFTNNQSEFLGQSSTSIADGTSINQTITPNDIFPSGVNICSPAQQNSSFTSVSSSLMQQNTSLISNASLIDDYSNKTTQFSTSNINTLSNNNNNKPIICNDEFQTSSSNVSSPIQSNIAAKFPPVESPVQSSASLFPIMIPSFLNPFGTTTEIIGGGNDVVSQQFDVETKTCSTQPSRELSPINVQCKTDAEITKSDESLDKSGDASDKNSTIHSTIKEETNIPQSISERPEYQTASLLFSGSPSFPINPIPTANVPQSSTVPSTIDNIIQSPPETKRPTEIALNAVIKDSVILDNVGQNPLFSPTNQNTLFSQSNNPLFSSPIIQSPVSSINISQITPTTPSDGIGISTSPPVIIPQIPMQSIIGLLPPTSSTEPIYNTPTTTAVTEPTPGNATMTGISSQPIAPVPLLMPSMMESTNPLAFVPTIPLSDPNQANLSQKD